MLPDLSELPAESAAYPNRHWMEFISEQQYCEICEEPLTDDEIECNDQFCDTCIGKENLEDDE